MALVKKLALKYLRTKFKVLSSINKKRTAEKAFELFTTPQHRNKKALPPVFQRAEKLQFTFNNLTVKGYRWNNGSEKKLLILHGFESSAVNFDRFVNPLVKLGYEVIAFDAPAHGRSNGKTINALQYKDFIKELNTRYGPIKNFITHSFGGLALSLALEEMKHDESFKAVLIAPATETITAANHLFRILKLDDEVRKEFDEYITNANNQPPSWYSVNRASANIKAQVLFLRDKDDDLTPLSDVEPLMKKNYQNFRFIISEGLGHRRIYRDQNTVKAIIDFFK
jgi:pimeloyl-ACP methyl ester carboxylesterase